MRPFFILCVFLTCLTLGMTKQLARQHRRAPSNEMHDCIFAVKVDTMGRLDSYLSAMASSDAISTSHLSREAVGTLISNNVASISVVDFLRRLGVNIVHQTLYGEFIVGRATIANWEVMFSTTFYAIEGSIFRAESITMPLELTEFVDSILNTVELPYSNVQALRQDVSGITVLQPNFIQNYCKFISFSFLLFLSYTYLLHFTLL